VITIAIQAGGLSSRMGSDKAAIKLAGIPLIEHVLARVEGLGDEILITTNHPDEYTYLHKRLVPDLTPGVGVLEGLHTALSAAAGNLVLVLACDMPFVSRPLLKHMLHLANDFDVVIPKHYEMYEPLHAVYRKRICLAAVERALAAGERRMISFLPGLNVHTLDRLGLAHLDPEGLSIFNINTPDDLNYAEQFLAQRDIGDQSQGL
jgi:molybdopterin-guanine dinucleotide biosynthesis protein A